MIFMTQSKKLFYGLNSTMAKGESFNIENYHQKRCFTLKLFKFGVVLN